MSQLEELRVLAESELSMPDNYRAALSYIDVVAEDVRNNPQSIEDRYLGLHFVRWNSFFGYVPLDYLAGVDIPLLFVHGELDWSVPVESTRIIDELNISPLFDFIYYDDMGHELRTSSQRRRPVRDIRDWLGG